MASSALEKRPDEAPSNHHVAYAIATAIATQVPVAWLADQARSRLLKRALGAIAARHAIVVPPEAMQILSRVPPMQLPWGGGRLAFTKLPVVGRAARWAALPIMAADATDLFVRLLLFETYCADLHTGVAIHGALAQRIHDTVGVTIADVPPQLMKSAKASLKAALQRRGDMLSEALRKLPRRGRSPADLADDGLAAVVPEVVDFEPLDAETAQILQHQGRLMRMLGATSQQFTGYKETLERFLQDSFRVRWKRDE